MTKVVSVVLGLAVAASAGMLSGCEGDASAPTRPRTQLTPLAPDDKSKENAEKRELEAPKQDYTGREFPSQSKADQIVVPTVITANAAAAAHGDKSKPIPTNGSDTKFPENRYVRDWYSGPMPHLPENPGSVPMAGSTKVPLTDLSIDNSWGQVMVLKETAHRDWPTAQVPYMTANGKYNPTYFATLQDRLPVWQNNGSFGGDWLNNLYEVPWFYGQLLAVPVEMCFECPFGQVTGQRLGWDPNYFGYLPAGGVVVPQPMPGVIKWDYPFLTSSAKDLTTLPANGAIAPTPGVTPAPLGLPSGGVISPASRPWAEQQGTPGLN